MMFRPVSFTDHKSEMQETLALYASISAILFVLLWVVITTVLVMICHWKKKENRYKIILYHLRNSILKQK